VQSSKKEYLIEIELPKYAKELKDEEKYKTVLKS